MSDKGTLFTDNTIFYDSNVSPSYVDFPESGIKVDACHKVPNVSGYNKFLLHQFFPGIPPNPQPAHFYARDHTKWAPGEKVVVTGPSSDGKNRIITLRGTETNQAAIFEERLHH